jgi:hypothetical protein
VWVCVCVCVCVCVWGSLSLSLSLSPHALFAPQVNDKTGYLNATPEFNAAFGARLLAWVHAHTLGPLLHATSFPEPLYEGRV